MNSDECLSCFMFAGYANRLFVNTFQHRHKMIINAVFTASGRRIHNSNNMYISVTALFKSAFTLCTIELVFICLSCVGLCVQSTVHV